MIHIKDTNDLRTYFREDILYLLIGIRSASVALNDQQRVGFDLAVTALCLSIGIDPALAGIAPGGNAESAL